MKSPGFFQTVVGVILLSLLSEGYGQYDKPMIVGMFVPMNNTAKSDYNRSNSGPARYGFQIPERQPNSYPSAPNTPVGSYPNYPNQGSYGNYGSNPPGNSYGNLNGRSGNGNNYSVGAGNTLTMGQREPGDKKIFQSPVTRKQKWWRSSIVEKEVEFPDPESKMTVGKITQIYVKDNTKNGSGGYTKVLKGGVGSKNVKMVFESKNGYPIDLLVTIYGFQY